MSGTLKNNFKHLLLSVVLLLGGFFCATAQSAYAQTPIDSLIKRMPVMMRSDEKSARQLLVELEKKAISQQHRHAIIQTVFFKAWLSYRHDPADIAISKIDSALHSIEGIQKDTALINFYILKGQCFVKKTQFGNALEQFKQALKIAEEKNDHESKTGTMVSIGWAYMEDGKSSEAIHFFNEVLRLNPSPVYANRALLLCNIAACYNSKADFDQAKTYALQGIAAAKSRGNNMDLANGLNILARSYYLQGQIQKAIACMKEATVAREKVADPSMLASDYLQLADMYGKNNQHKMAIQWAKKAEAISGQQANALKLSAAYKTLAETYEALGDYKRALLYLKKVLQQKDSLAVKQYNEAFAQMQVQFETQKKTAENLQLKKENLETRLKNSNQQRWLLLLGTGLILLVATSIYITKLIKSRYRTRLALEQLHEQKKRAIAVMEAEEKERRRIAGDLHDGVGQMLAAASMQLIKAKKGGLPLEKVDELIGRAGREVRNISHQVTPELLLHYGLVRAIEQEVDRLNEAHDSTHFELFTHVEAPLKDDMLSLTLYRCFQELCANISKHAKASEVAVQLNLHADEVQLMVEDDGIGFQPGKTVSGLGMRNMESRIALYDGELLVDSTPGRGTTCIIKIKRPVVKEIRPKTAELWKQ